MPNTAVHDETEKKAEETETEPSLDESGESKTDECDSFESFQVTQWKLDELDSIFNYLSAEDLSRAAQVCRCWRMAATKERDRRGPECHTIPCITEKFIPQNLKIRPRALLIFTRVEFTMMYLNRLKNRGYDPAKCKTIVIGCTDLWDNYNCHNTNEALGIYLPETSRMCVESFNLSLNKSCQLLSWEILREAKKIVNALIYEPMFHTCIILFVYLPDTLSLESKENLFVHILLEVFNELSKRYRPGAFSFWGMCCEDVGTQPSLVTISISGSGFKSWTIVLDRKSKQRQIEAELKEFARHVFYNSNSLAIMSTSPNEEDERLLKETMRMFHSTFKKIFPTVTLQSIVKLCGIYELGINSTKEDIGSKLYCKDSISIVLFTYL